MVPCGTCKSILLSRRFDLESNLDKCRACVSWNFDDCNAHQRNMLKIEREKYHPFPSVIGKEAISAIYPRRLTFHELEEAVKTTHNHLVNCKWTKSESQSYLKLKDVQN